MILKRSELPALWVLAASARWLVASLCRSPSILENYQVIAVDLFGDHDLLRFAPHVSATDWEAIVDHRPWRSGDLVLYGGGWENHVDRLNQFSHGIRVLGFSLESLQHTKTPEIWGPLLHDAGFQVPTCRCVSDRDHKPNPSKHWLLKPLRSAGGHRIQWWSIQSLPDSIDLVNESWFLQEYIPGPSWSASFLATSEQVHLLGACGQWSGAVHHKSRPFQYQGSWGPIPLQPTARNRLDQLGMRIRDHFGGLGLFGVDLVGAVDRDWSVIEINPRPTSSMEILERSAMGAGLDISLVADHFRACLGMPVNMGWIDALSTAPGWGKRLLVHRDPTPLVISVLLFENLCRWETQGVAADIPRAGTVIAPGQPVCTLFAGGIELLEIGWNLARLEQQWKRWTDEG